MPNKLFIFALIASFITGIYGLAIGDLAIGIPYLLIDPAILIAFGSLRKIKSVAKITSVEWQNTIRILGSAILLLNIPGSVYLHSTGLQYDVILHFLSMLLVYIGVVLIYPVIFYHFTNRLPGHEHHIIAAFIISIVIGFAAEGFQKLIDVIFGTHLFSDVSQPIVVDFLIDILMDVLGAIVGVFYILRHQHLVPGHISIQNESARAQNKN